MKLRFLTSNNDNIFPRINFNSGLNVVLAKVQMRKSNEDDSHNLGKTFLIEVIDFALLKKTNKSHSFKMHSDLFGEFIFYLGLETNAGTYLLVKRQVKGRNPVSILVSENPIPDISTVTDEQWTHSNIGIDKGRTILDSELNLEVVHPYGYRKGLGYCLRKQGDYDDEFLLNRFERANHSEWKPYLAKILGLNSELVGRKYELDDAIEEGTKYRDRVMANSGNSERGFDEIRSELELRRERVELLRSKSDSFSFGEIEDDITEEVATIVESEINELNKKRYNMKRELREIQASLKRKYHTDNSILERLFAEMKMHFQDDLKKTYNELVEFNRRISSSRFKRLKLLKNEIDDQLIRIDGQLKVLNRKRQSIFGVLEQKETLKKYREIQRELSRQDSMISDLTLKLDKMNQGQIIQEHIEENQLLLSEVSAKIRKHVHSEIPHLFNLRATFSSLVSEIIDVTATLSVDINNKGNLEFKIKTIDKSEEGRETSQSKGTTYRKILCACFDLATLYSYSNQPYYQFVYHDGIFETLDNKKKEKLLKVVRAFCEKYNMQYILTVIEDSLPRDSHDNLIQFSDSEVVRMLHDGGESGRLFRMRKF